jgi:aryl-alcohol dehydrogenase-like predicted oxidoreductase
MRYRPFGGTEMAVSAVSLSLSDSSAMRDPGAWRNYVYAALECGINAFELTGVNAGKLEGAGQGLRSVDRRLTFVSLRLSPGADGEAAYSAGGLRNAIDAAHALTEMPYFDLVTLEEPGDGALPKDGLEALLAMREAGQIKAIGVAGEGSAIDPYINTGKFDALCIPYSLKSGWITRNRMREAIDHNMAIIGYGYYPPNLGAPAPKPMFKTGLWGRKSAEDLHDEDAYAFLHDTPGWTAEQICLAYALTQPALATIQLPTEAAPRLEELAAVAEREMPPGLAPRIEMARWGDVPRVAQA